MCQSCLQTLRYMRWKGHSGAWYVRADCNAEYNAVQNGNRVLCALLYNPKTDKRRSEITATQELPRVL